MPTLRVYCLKGEGLLAGDRTTSDPYISLLYNNKKAKSKVRKNTLDPQWPEFDHTFDFVRAPRPLGAGSFSGGAADADAALRRTSTPRACAFVCVMTTRLGTRLWAKWRWMWT